MFMDSLYHAQEWETVIYRDRVAKYFTLEHEVEGIVLCGPDKLTWEPGWSG